MNLAQIRQKTAYLEQPKNHLPTAGRVFATHIFKGTVAVTLSLKQSVKVVTDKGTYYKRLDRDDCKWIAERFKKKLNQAVYGNAAKRFNKSLRFLPSVEGGAGGMNLHLHMVIGEFPGHIKWNEIEALIIKAKNKVAEINKQYRVEICDSGWAEYAVKTITQKSTDSVLWDLA
jgi:hypothetical protein